MRTSESIKEIATALSKAQAEMGAALKDASNPFFKSKYADLASVWDACRAPLTKQGLSIAQFPTTTFGDAPEVFTWKSKSGEERIGVKVVCVVSVVTRLLHASGEWIEDTASAMLATGDPQAVGSAITYLRRYSLQSVAGVAPEDDDGEGTARTNKSHTEPAVAKPEGFDVWVLDLEVIADSGREALNAVWAKSHKDYREYLQKTDATAVDRLRARAAKAKVGA